MIDVLMVDRRFCWEPLCGMDTSILISVCSGDIPRLVIDHMGQREADWIATLLIDSMGCRVVVFFDDMLPTREAERVLMLVLDGFGRKITISGITSIEGEG